MRDLGRVTELAEAVADGKAPDWKRVLSTVTDPVDRGVMTELRAVHAIHTLIATSATRHGEEAGRIVLEPGNRWGALEIREHIGRGRFGDVYRAWDPALDRDVALKLLRHREGQERIETRIVEEGRLMARVRHSSVVTIYGAQRIDGVSGIWMEQIEGRTLAAELAERGPFPADELVKIGSALAHALDAVHAAGLVHRDVKAQNVLRDTTGRVLLGDFGTGHQLHEPQGLVGLAGTPAYLAPEIFEGQPATPQSDLYSLGALLFYLATGRHAVSGRTVSELRDAHRLGARLSLHVRRPDLPSGLRDVVERALDPDPARRFERGAAMAAALDSCTARSDASTGTARVAVITAGLALIVGAAVFGLVHQGPGPGAANPPATKLVLVTEFENGTGEPTLDATLTPSLARALSGSSAFGVVPAARVQETLALMRRPSDTSVDTRIAREVALRDGDVVAVVTGRVERRGDTYALRVEARDPRDGSVLASLDEPRIAHGAVIETIGKLAFAVRRQLTTSVPLSTPPGPGLPRVTTSSLRALELYARVFELRDAEGLLTGREAEAERLLRDAIAEDPDFALAHTWLAIVVRLDGERRGQVRLQEALAHAERAVSVSSGVSSFERLRVQEQRHLIKFLMNPPESEAAIHGRALIASCEELLQLRPDDPDVLLGCVNVYSLTGTPNPDVAIRLAELRPGTARWQMAAAEAILSAAPDQLDRARPFVQRAARLEPIGRNQAFGVARARLFEAGQAWLDHRPLQALQIADGVRDRMAALPLAERQAFAQQLWGLYLDLGQLRRAEEMAAEIIPWPNRRNAEVIIATVREDPQSLRELLERQFPRIEEAGGVASAYLEAGLLPESRVLIEAHRRMEAARPGNFSQYLRMLEGNLALREGRADQAISQFERFLEIHGSRTHDTRWRRVMRMLAEAKAARGDVADAIIVLEAASQPPGMLSGSRFVDWLVVREQLAGLYRRVGHGQKAAALESELRELLAVADDDHPIKRRLSELPMLAP